MVCNWSGNHTCLDPKKSFIFTRKASNHLHSILVSAGMIHKETIFQGSFMNLFFKSPQANSCSSYKSKWCHELQIFFLFRIQVDISNKYGEGALISANYYMDISFVYNLASECDRFCLLVALLIACPTSFTFSSSSWQGAFKLLLQVEGKPMIGCKQVPLLIVSRTIVLLRLLLHMIPLWTEQFWLSYFSFLIPLYHLLYTSQIGISCLV